MIGKEVATRTHNELFQPLRKGGGGGGAQHNEQKKECKQIIQQRGATNGQ